MYGSSYMFRHYIAILNEYLVYLLVFNAYINEMRGSRSKIPSKKISLRSVARKDLIPALKG
jgi:hypothetical protein